MPKQSEHLGGLEEAVLLAIQQLGSDAYGVLLHETLADAGRHISIGSLYVTLNRLEEKGFVRSRIGEPTPERGGRSKRYFSLDGGAIAALEDAEATRKHLRSGRMELGGLA